MVFLIPRSHSARVTAVNLPVLFPITWQDYCGCRADVNYAFKLWVGFPTQDFDVSVTWLLVIQTDGYSVISGKTEQQKVFLHEYLKPLVTW